MSSMPMKLGFIGCGNMGSAFIGGVIRSGYAQPDEIIAAEPLAEGRERVKSQYAIHVTDSNTYVLSQAQTVFLCVKPQVVDSVLAEIRGVVEDYQLIVTIVAGKPLDYYDEMFGRERHIKVVRLMPNTPALIGQGMTAVCANPYTAQGDLNEVLRIVESLGLAEVVPESMFDTVTAVSGSSPACVFMFIEALADAAVRGGMSRAQAYKFVSQAVAGSAQLVLQTGRHPAELKDMVCSPAGTSIEAVQTLEERGFRAAVMEAMGAAGERSARMRLN